MRKYDKKNKTNILTVSLICVVILIGFSLFIKRVIDLDKKEYLIDANSVLFNSDKEKLVLEGTGTIKIKWNGAYYLNYDNEEYKLDRQVVVYNNANKLIKLYGTIYKINGDESIDTLKDETVINDVINPKFYKLADRKYLIVSETIRNEANTFLAQDYLIIELDKMGNATLTNNKIHMKTLMETNLVTSNYIFDIANEKLIFGNTIIDLKKIIGSTNEYIKKEESKIDNINSGNGSGSGSGNGSQNKAQSNSSNSESTKADSKGSKESEESSRESTKESEESKEESTDNPSVPDKPSQDEPEPVKPIVDNRIYQDKNFSIVKNTIGTNYITIDYSIYDPKNEYKNVSMEIERTDTLETESYYLAKNGSSLTINGLLPNTRYNIRYRYSYLDSKGNVLYDSFDANYSFKTLLPDTVVNITRLSNKELTYEIRTDEKLLYGANVELYINGVLEGTYTFNTEVAESKLTGKFDLTTYSNIEYIEIRVPSVRYATGYTETNLLTRVMN